MKHRLALLALFISIAHCNDDGLARTPPRGWRDWNQYQGAINQEIMETSFRALADRSRKVAGASRSLSDLGYTDAGLDDGWQLCGSHGPQKYTYHDVRGNPVVDTGKFPDMKAMTDLAHRLNLTAGWYENNCNCNSCSDHCATVECFAGDVNATLSLGFDSIKLDGCGAQRDIALWSEMFRHATQNKGLKPIMVENCHDGMSSNPPGGHGADPGNIPHYDKHGELWCPFHMYRSSGDARPTYGAMLVNLNTTVALAAKNLSVPGCWAYPDMLEVGVTNAQLPMPGHKMNCGPTLEDPCPPLTFTEAQTHFGAWAIVSSPLILGFNLSDTHMLDQHWETITNQDALEVNSDYAGFSGSRFAQSTDTVDFTPCGWGPSFKNRTDGSCTWARTMSWYKPLSGRDTRGSRMAVLLMNNGNTSADISFAWSDIPGLGASMCTVYDVWAGKSLRQVHHETFTVHGVTPRGSAFLTLSDCL